MFLHLGASPAGLTEQDSIRGSTSLERLIRQRVPSSVNRDTTEVLLRDIERYIRMFRDGL